MDRLSSKGSMIDQIDLGNAPRSGFDRSFHNYLSGKLGKIIPTRCEEVLPGDRIKGNSHIVANFEPLVAPILGTMVLKQETFYVPQSQLWKNAHNFFTGKKGFEGKIPSVSQKILYQAIDHYTFRDSHGSLHATNIFPLDSIVLDNLNDVGNLTPWAEVSSVSDIQDYVEVVYNSISEVRESLYDWSVDEKVYDLVSPLFYIIDNFKVGKDTNNVYYFGDGSLTVEQQKEYFEQFIIDCYNFWFGPSSLCDYLGVGIYNMSERVHAFFANLNYPAPEGGSDYSLPFVEYFSEIPFTWLPFRGSYAIWYWNYRDQLLEADALDAEEFADTDVISGREIPLLLLLRVRCWFKDTFTTALTNTGNGNVLIPSIASLYSQDADSLTVHQVAQNLSQTTDAQAAVNAGASVQKFEIGGIEYQVPSNYLWHDVQFDGEHVSENSYYVSLDMIDRAKRLSKWLSKRLILGCEYDDVIYSSFMVKMSNVRMHIPELLDASRSTVAMNTVVNNTTTDEQIAGDKTAIAWAENSSDGVNYFSEEHGYLFSYMTVLPIQSYAGGIQRMWLRQTRFDFAWPEFAQMGMDAVYNCELATPNGIEEGRYTDAAALAVFGYQGRYYDYKSKLDEEHGRMRSDLNYMTFSRDFSLAETAKNKPLLNYIFVHCWPSLDMFVTDDPNIDIIRQIDVAHNYQWERVLPVPSETV